MKMQRKDLTTERRNPATEDLDTMTALELVTAMNHEDAVVPRAIKRVLPEIGRAVEIIAAGLSQGGRMIYVGAGTSGRIGALDASECTPTFGAPPEMVQFLIAGGEQALVQATEASEDSGEQGRLDMAAKKPCGRDVVIGLAASGYTPYTISALEYARCKGASTIGITCNRGSDLGKAAALAIEVDVGPEVLTGSSRLKAGTAQKLICNMLSTGAMVQLGYVYSNLMVNLHMKNKKLLERGVYIVQTIAQVDRDAASHALEQADMSLPVALVMLKANVNKAEALRRLDKAKGSVRMAIAGSTHLSGPLATETVEHCR
jgi:N-acetylmuramic acid 6-phosphate etherase